MKREEHKEKRGKKTSLQILVNIRCFVLAIIFLFAFSHILLPLE